MVNLIATMKLNWTWIEYCTILVQVIGALTFKQSNLLLKRSNIVNSKSLDLNKSVEANQSETKTCVLDSECEKAEICKTRYKSRFGLCVCDDGFKRSVDGTCTSLGKELREINSTDVPSLNFSENGTLSEEVTTAKNNSTVPSILIEVSPTVITKELTTESDVLLTTKVPQKVPERETTFRENYLLNSTIALSTPAPPIRKLVVSAGGSNHVLQLPENKISLSAFAVPDPPEGEEYKYEWNLISHPAGDDTGREEDRHTKTLQLSNLKEGLYTFKVEVTGKGAYGETYVNVTVKPPKRVNTPPVAVISPKNVTIKLPNTDAVLDGSQSTDDEKIVKYDWEEVVSPIGYEAKLTDSATLQLKDLVAGFYQFKLTITDSDGETNSTVADVAVMKEVDYPPVANAGEDVVIFLPTTEYVLNGNLSTDDKGIKSWEWSKSPETTLTVDVQGTTSPFLHLSKLQKGMYKFVLKVTDEGGQSGSATVHIFVKENQQQNPPVVDAGEDQEINLVDKCAILDGRKTKNTDIVAWKWSQISGPNAAVLENASEKKTKANKITVGKYEFQLEVTDKFGHTGQDKVIVTVKQLKNNPPKANGGGGKTVVMPVKVVYLNGSLSSDDRGITSYKWTRDPSSLTAGEIIENSDSKPILKIINLVPGRYIFTLTVTDDQGETSSDSVSLIVKREIEYKDEVQIILNVDLKSYTEENKETLKNKLALLLNEGSPINVVIKRIFSEFKTGRVVVVFCVYVKNSNSEEIVRGPDVVMRLKEKLNTDNLLDFDIVSLDTVVCQNNCSNHGTCEPYTKRCVCDAFWMEDFIRVLLGDNKSNCGQIQKSSLMVSESDTDSDSLFERNRVKLSNNNGQSKMNGSVRHSRKVQA
ncbi:Dyslexia-associated protein KIAA0319-like protein [Nymphon striatum]|nr:Dyslexia-associated protein KIAA0319-like protein [Nymphon striatum]